MADFSERHPRIWARLVKVLMEVEANVSKRDSVEHVLEICAVALSRNPPKKRGKP